MQVQPVSIDQVMVARNGKRIPITSDVGDVAKDLKSIDKNFELHAKEYYENGKQKFYFEIRCFNPKHGKSYLVSTATELDQRIVDGIRQVTRPGYDVIAEQEKIEKEAKKQKDYETKQRIGEAGEQLAYAMRKDKGIKKNF